MLRTHLSLVIFFLLFAQASLAQKLKVMSYNIHHANPPSRKDSIDIDAIVKVIKAQDPALVALQEVDVNTGRSGNRNQATEIAQKLGMQVFFGKAIDHDGGDYGVAILSKFPISDPKVYRLPTLESTGGEPRVLATVNLKLADGRRMIFGSTHLDAQRDSVNREMQIREINRIAALEKLPFVIAGDFNAPPGSGVIKTLDQQFSRTCTQCEPTIPVINPQKTIDFIAFKPDGTFKVLSNTVVQEKYASDHLPVVAVLQIK